MFTESVDGITFAESEEDDIEWPIRKEDKIRNSAEKLG